MVQPLKLPNVEQIQLNIHLSKTETSVAVLLGSYLVCQYQAANTALYKSVLQRSHESSFNYYHLFSSKTQIQIWSTRECGVSINY